MTDNTTPQQSIPLTNEQANALKGNMLISLSQAYSTFIQSIQHLPINLKARELAFSHLDTGFIWFKEGILNMPIVPLAPAATAVQAEAQKSDDIAA